MDRSIPGLPDPVAVAPNGERRRCVRQKLHTPVYVSFNGPQTGMVLDLSELLDLHEDGFAVQTSERLETNRAVTLCLDLPETTSYIHGSGQVIWSDETGRGGIRFAPLQENSRHLLKEWLFANLLIACSNHAARTEQLARRAEEKSPEPAPVSKSRAVVPISDPREPMSSVETVRHEVLQIGGDFDAVLRLITERALSLTGASGAALAFLTDDNMICRARTGQPAPPLGAPVDVKQGLSGECVRSGSLVSCEDTENDPRIDPQVGRALGIGSLMAVPIVSDFRVVGLLEVVSPHPRSFTETHGAILARLVEMIPKIHRDRTRPENAEPENVRPEARIRAEAVSPPTSESDSTEPGSTEPGSTEFDSIPAIREALKDRQPEAPELLSQPGPGETVLEQVPEEIPGQVPETEPTAPSRWPYWATIAVVAIAAGYLLGPTIEKRWAGSPQASQRSLVDAAPAVSAQPAADQRAAAKSLPELRKLADEGDADAQYQMGIRYHNGEDVPHDDAEAMRWFLRAAEQGNVTAQTALGSYYWAGRGVAEDLSKAYMWSEIALAGGDANSKARLEGLATQMTQAQVAAARQQAEEWLHSHHQRAKSEAN
jgi:GAF domain/Sel1 repeat/PilZ domain